MATCAISGAVGTFANIDPSVEDYVAKKLGFRQSPFPRKSSRVIAMPCISPYWPSWPASIERLATEIRHLQRTEVLEVEEYLCARPEGFIRHAAQAQPGADGKSHWPCTPRAFGGHSRLSKTWPCGTSATFPTPSVERGIGPDATVHLDFALKRLDRRHRQTAGLSRKHEAQSGQARRPHPFAAHSSGPHAERHEPGSLLCRRAAQRHAGLARRREIFSTC